MLHTFSVWYQRTWQTGGLPLQTQILLALGGGESGMWVCGAAA